MSRRFMHFLLIGGIAFWLDAAAYFASGELFIRFLGNQAPPLQKVLGFAVGVATTYLYNSKVTFSAALGWWRFGRYLGSQVFGMVVNLIVFLAFRQFTPALASLAAATIVASLANYLGAKFTLNA